MSRKRDWPWWKVKGLLESRGKTLKDVAVENGFSRWAAIKVKRIPIPRLQALIAVALDRRPQDIWPTRYDRRGQPVRPYAVWIKNNTVDDPRNVQKRKAA